MKRFQGMHKKLKCPHCGVWVGLGYGYGNHIKTHFRQDLEQDEGHTKAHSDDGNTYDEAGDGFLDENTSATDAENGPLEGSPLTAAARLNVLWEAGMLDVNYFLRYDGWDHQGQLIANDVDLPARFLSAIAGSSGASEDATQRVLDFIHSIGVHATLPRSVLGCWGSIQQVHVPSRPRIPFHARLFLFHLFL